MLGSSVLNLYPLAFGWWGGVIEINVTHIELLLMEKQLDVHLGLQIEIYF